MTQIIFDKDRGLEILVRALGGTYLPLKNGVPTGFNPLRLAPTAANIEFLKTWLRALVRGTVPLTIREEADLDHALMGTLALDERARRLSRLVEFTDATKPEGIQARLARWCDSTQGDYAWVFDNLEDSLVGELSKATLFGADVTDFLDNVLTRSPVTLYLFHVIRNLLDGRKLVCWMDEFWRLLGDPAFENFAKDGPKTWRKLNGVMCLATQSASDARQVASAARLSSRREPESSPAPQRTRTRLNTSRIPGFPRRGVQTHQGTTRAWLRGSSYRSKGTTPSCTQWNLKGFGTELKVISGRASTVEGCTESISSGPDPAGEWLPVFQSLPSRREYTDASSQELLRC